jgi:23S rRNA (adenine2030-N6)-methyltransferase
LGSVETAIFTGVIGGSLAKARRPWKKPRMNYRHSFHAGNFADVMKHIVLSRIIEYLKLKDKAFRVIDTHAGSGLYALTEGNAAHTGEWHGGIEKLLNAMLGGKTREIVLPYILSVQAQNGSGKLEAYPGSPKIARSLLRNQDRLTAIELHPKDAKLLAKTFEGDFQTRVIELDGWLSLGAHLPPKEKRGLVLIDPPFEEPGEFERMHEGLQKAHSRWPGGIYALWYPVKDRAAVAMFHKGLAQSGIAKILRAELMIRGGVGEPRLDGCGMIVVNPPFVLEAELRKILPALAQSLGEDAGAGFRLEWIAGE